jgi:hypothetical protein
MRSSTHPARRTREHVVAIVDAGPLATTSAKRLTGRATGGMSLLMPLWEGIDHWCDTVRRTAPSARRYACEALALDGVPLELITQEGDTHRLDRSALCRGLGLYAQKHGWPEDLGDIDAEAADLIVQYALFGEVVYS